MGKSQGNLPYWFCAAENVVFAYHVRCPPVQTFHNSIGNFRVHGKVTFLANGDERPLLMGCFLKRLEKSTFPWRRLCRCAIDRLGHAFPRTLNIFTNSPDSKDLFGLQLHGCNVLLGKFGETFFCFVSFVSSGTKASATLGENRRGHVCLLLFLHEWQNPELLKGYPYFQNALLILTIFQNKYGTAVMGGMYVIYCRLQREHL